MFLLGAEAKSQPVRPGAGTLIRRPRVNHHAAVPAKDIGGPSWTAQRKTNMIINHSPHSGWYHRSYGTKCFTNKEHLVN